MGLRKVERLGSVSAEVVATANPGCTPQLTMLLGERAVTLHAAHPVDLLDCSFRGVSFL